MNYEYDPLLEKPVRYISNYDKDIFMNSLRSNYGDLEKVILNEIANENLNGALLKLEEKASKAYKSAKIKVG